MTDPRPTDRDGTPDDHELLAATYAELRRLASAFLRGERAGHTLQPTALVHEAWCRLGDQARDASMSHERFVATAARIMRHVLVDHARTRGAVKRGGMRGRAGVDLATVEAPAAPLDVLELDEALGRLRDISELQATLVELRFFGGLTLDEAALVLGLPSRSADREWSCAKAWLFDALRTGDGPSA
ncbi:MAG: RNA polymerase subunit sigma-70 [Phycisphaerae bacterium]|nr:RNA polymerase subunit sigma-70 [Phycisphaerae bacterium]